MQHSERICCAFNSILKLDRNHADKTSSLKYTHGTLQKHNDLCLTKKKKKKQEKKVKQNHYT